MKQPAFQRSVQLVSIGLTLILLGFILWLAYHSWQKNQQPMTLNAPDPLIIKDLEKRFKQRAFSVHPPLLQAPFSVPEDTPTPHPTQAPTSLPTPNVRNEFRELDELLANGDFTNVLKLCHEKESLLDRQPAAQFVSKAQHGLKLLETGKELFFARKTDQATQVFEEVLAIAPRSPEAKAYLERLTLLQAATPAAALPVSPLPSAPPNQQLTAPEIAAKPTMAAASPTVKLDAPTKVLKGEILTVRVAIDNPHLVSQALLYYRNEQQGDYQIVRMVQDKNIFSAVVPKKHVATNWIDYTVELIGFDGKTVTEPIRGRVAIGDVAPAAPPI